MSLEHVRPIIDKFLIASNIFHPGFDHLSVLGLKILEKFLVNILDVISQAYSLHLNLQIHVRNNTLHFVVFFRQEINEGLLIIDLFVLLLSNGRFFLVALLKQLL